MNPFLVGRVKQRIKEWNLTGVEELNNMVFCSMQQA